MLLPDKVTVLLEFTDMTLLVALTDRPDLWQEGPVMVLLLMVGSAETLPKSHVIP